MNLLIIIALAFVIVILFSSAKKRENLEKYHKKNNASFVAEIEEYARWSKTIFFRSWHTIHSPPV